MPIEITAVLIIVKAVSILGAIGIAWWAGYNLTSRKYEKFSLLFTYTSDGSEHTKAVKFMSSGPDQVLLPADAEISEFHIAHQRGLLPKIKVQFQTVVAAGGDSYRGFLAPISGQLLAGGIFGAGFEYATEFALISPDYEKPIESIGQAAFEEITLTSPFGRSYPKAVISWGGQPEAS